IFFKYDANNLEDKIKNKLELQKILGLEVNPDIPVIGIVSRLVSQKGFDLISYIMPELIREDLQLVILGTGEQQYQSMFNYYSSLYCKKVSARITFDSGFAQQIYSGSDMFLMPSLFEPCGIGQMLAMRYGTLPIVRETGGLKDTVEPYNQYTGDGNGFSFANYNAHEMLYCIQRALKVYKDKDMWYRLVENAMHTDNSWKKSAQKYIEAYQGILN
ncbi:MAG: glycosyltransferase, partial [Peptostreptococcaceae bacterium]|nr:glycosyltransferase [Peptostreptococcaceae bacterium]